MRIDDFLELPLALDCLDDDEVFDLHVVTPVEGNPHVFVLFQDVNGVVRSDGFWHISHVWMNRRVSSMIPAESVSYFRVLTRKAPLAAGFVSEPVMSPATTTEAEPVVESKAYSGWPCECPRTENPDDYWDWQVHHVPSCPRCEECGEQGANVVVLKNSPDRLLCEVCEVDALSEDDPVGYLTRMTAALGSLSKSLSRAKESGEEPDAGSA